MKVIDDIVDDVCSLLGRVPSQWSRRLALNAYRERRLWTDETDMELMTGARFRDDVVDYVLRIGEKEKKIFHQNPSMKRYLVRLEPEAWEGYVALTKPGLKNYTHEQMSEVIRERGEGWLMMVPEWFDYKHQPTDLNKLVDAIEIFGEEWARISDVWALRNSRPLLEVASLEQISSVDVAQFPNIAHLQKAGHEPWKYAQREDHEKVFKRLNELRFRYDKDIAEKIAVDDDLYEVFKEDVGVGLRTVQKQLLERIGIYSVAKVEKAALREIWDLEVEKTQLDYLADAVEIAVENGTLHSKADNALDWMIEVAVGKADRDLVEEVMELAGYQKGFWKALHDNVQKGTGDNWLRYVRDEIRKRAIGGGQYDTRSMA